MLLYPTSLFIHLFIHLFILTCKNLLKEYVYNFSLHYVMDIWKGSFHIWSDLL